MWELFGIAALALLIFGVVAVVVWWWNHLDTPPLQ
jgi:hypothetical protein